MKELEIQMYLRSGKTLDELKEEFAIKANFSECGNLVNLKYNQIESNKNLNIVRECRGIILEIGSWNIVSRGFYRFFNYGEEIENETPFNFNSKNISVFEKSDGSVIQLFYYNNEWRISTSGTIDANCNANGGNYTFAQLFNRAQQNTSPELYDRLDYNCIYTFELVSPLNRIVRPYDKTALILLNVRENFEEVPVETLYSHARNISVPMAKEFRNLKTEEDVVKAVEELDNLHEGYVLVDYNEKVSNSFRRIKLKASQYVEMHHLKESNTSSVKRMMNVVIENEVDEVCSYFPELKELFEPLENAWTNFRIELSYAYDSARHLISENMSKEDNKELALLIMDNPYKHFIFDMKKRNIKLVDDLINDCFTSEINRLKLIKWLIQRFKLKEVELADE